MFDMQLKLYFCVCAILPGPGEKEDDRMDTRARRLYFATRS